MKPGGCIQQTMRAAEKLFSARAIDALFLSAVDHRAYAKLLAAILFSGRENL